MNTWTDNRRRNTRPARGTNFTVPKVRDAMWHVEQARHHLQSATRLMLPAQAPLTRHHKHRKLRAEAGDVADVLTTIDGHLARQHQRLAIRLEAYE